MDLSDLPVIDGHCHPLLVEPWDVEREQFLALFSEGRPGTMGDHVLHTGYLQRALRGLGARLGCPPAVAAVLEHRARAGAEACATLRAARVEALLVDTGYPSEAMALAEMARLLPCAVHEVFRIERCAERLLRMGLPWAAFRDAFAHDVRAAAEHCAGLKTIVAYRSGLAIRPWDDGEAAAAYARELARLRAGGPGRLDDKPLMDTLVLTALDVAQAAGIPLQVHSGFGDPDIDLVLANPALLRPILEDPRRSGARIVLLHMSYPHFREAACMTAVWPQVYLDLSLALPFLGPGAMHPLLEVLSLAPSSKLLYGSDVSALPELFALSADWGRAALGEALDWLVAREGLTTDGARTVAAQVLAGNARSLYRLATAPA